MARVTIEDCAEVIGNRYDLVLVAAKRTRQLLQGRESRLPNEGDKTTVIALREIAAGLVDRNVLSEGEELSEQEIFSLPDIDDASIDMSRDEDEDEEDLDEGSAHGMEGKGKGSEADT